MDNNLKDYNWKSLSKTVNFDRNVEILRSILNGASYEEIALKFKLVVSTVKSNTRQILRCIKIVTLDEIIKQEFPRHQFPNAYFINDDFFYITRLSISEQRMRKVFLLNQLDKIMERVNAVRDCKKIITNSRVYYSDRGFPLLYVGQPLEMPVVTLENYTKWYKIFLVMPDGTVKPVEPGLVTEIASKHSDACWVDHIFHPRLLYRIATQLKATVDERAIEVATGRWMLEVCEDDSWKFSEPE